MPPMHIEGKMAAQDNAGFTNKSSKTSRPEPIHRRMYYAYCGATYCIVALLACVERLCTDNANPQLVNIDLRPQANRAYC